MTSEAAKRRSLKELGRIVAFRREYSAICDDDIKCGLFLSQADYWTGISMKMGRSGWFYKKHDDWYEEIGLSRSELELVRKKLTDRGFVQEKRKGTPPVMHYRVDQAVLKDAVQSLYGEAYAEREERNAEASLNDEVQLRETSDYNCRKPTNANAGNLHYNTETTAETTSNINNILPTPALKEEFEAFWRVYPRRPGNPKHKAYLSYVKARQALKVPKEDIFEKVKAYALLCEGKDPRFIKWAVNWLNGRGWEDDYGSAADVKISTPLASDEQLDAVVKVYPGVVSDRMAARKHLAAELAKGTGLEEIIAAATKFRIHMRQMRESGMTVAEPILETWLKFKWREMDAYEIYSNPVERRPILRPVKGKRQ